MVGVILYAFYHAILDVDNLVRLVGYTAFVGYYDDGQLFLLVQIFQELHHFDVDTYIPIEELHHFGRFYEDTPFVAELPFYGDMTTYGISFADE